jgi:hypothetical protein
VPIKLQKPPVKKKKERKKKEQKIEKSRERERAADFGVKPIMLRWPYL